MRIACLHTAQSNVGVFDAVHYTMGREDVMLRHHVRPDLLAAAEQAGGLTPEIVQQTGAALLALSHEADAVLLTCSTLGPSIAAAEGRAAVPVLRVDEALAREAVRRGGMVVALCAAESTVAPTSDLFEAALAAADTAARVEVHLVEGAWAAFKAGDLGRYHRMIAAAADRAAEEGATCVALAQASMAEAARLSRSPRPPLTSPTVGFAAAIRAANQ